ncbi:MAG: o-succinylbenzoate synthase [Anaerolineae bacterium]|nr:o-succinylbenzoate synthase [Anaerolineae bacterium]MDK1080508.1 o-succinylbenzoate synthase [Anaerolineae bacterium]
MILDSIRLYHLRLPLVSPFETSFGRIDHKECILVEIHSGGLVGYGESSVERDPGYNYETVGTAWHIINEFVAPLILGQDIKDAAEFQSLVAGIRGHNLAKAGLEMALWDLLGKSEGVSLKQMLGGEREKVEVGVSIGIQETTSSLVRSVEGYIEQGYNRIKIKIKPGRDIEETSTIRNAFPDIPLQVDANSAYSLETSQVLKPLDDMDLLLIEQPLFEDDLWEHRKMQAQFKTPICLDESIISVRHARYALEMDACRIINIKPGRVGGLSQGLAIHNLCHQKNVPVWCGGMLETGIGRAANLALASLPGFSMPGDISASDRYFQQDITNEKFILNPDSTIEVPSGPGLGVTINEDALQHFTVDKIEIKS